MRVRHLAIVLLFGLMVATGTSACVDRPLITFTNHRDERVFIHIDGDRVLILRPHTSEGLPYQVASWTWPRHIEARDPTNHTFLSLKASAGDLALQHWRVDIR
jgi:hypothetical protein